MGKDCGNHADEELRNFCRALLCFIAGLIVVVLLIVLIVWLVLRPTKPHFYLQDAAVRQLDVSNSSDLISVSFQVTIASRNPNDRIGVYYDRLDVYATYKSQQITLPSRLPPVYQGHGDVDVWSPVLAGANVPVAPFLADALQQDSAAGYLLLSVRIDGRVRWKVGSWVSGHYHLFGSCPAFLVGPPNSAGGGTGLHFQQLTECTIEV